MPCLVEPYFLSLSRASSSASSSRCHGSSREARSLTFRFSGERHAVAENVHHALAEDAAGQQVQGELALIVHDGVARVAAALIAHDHVEMVGEVVDHAALALVAPVDAYDRTIRHDNSLLNISSVL